VQEDKCGGNIMYIHMCVNGKMRHVENIPGMEEKGIKENDGEGEFNSDILQELW
jgi:hypothetical protein